MRVGFIGIGSMGWPMAANVLKAGHDITVYDTDADRSARFASEHGGKQAPQLAQLASVEAVITMLPNGHIVREVYTELGPYLQPGTVAIDMSSSDPTGTRSLGQALARSGVVLLDAPVSGTVTRAQPGTLTIMIGGDDRSAIERVKPLLGSMGNRLFETGSLGSGHAMKALNNFVAAAGFAAAAEALLAGQRFGLDAGRMLEIMNVSTGRNFNTEVVMSEHVVGRKFATGFALGLLAKDVRIAADLAAATDLDAPLTRLVAERYALAQGKLGGARDNTEAILSWDNSLPK
jgi:3-hydroxyisobutyrate dehydrogenase